MTRAMTTALVVATLLVWLLGSAAAAPARTSKVSIETEPPGATVYFNLKEDGAVCTTPCEVDAPIGDTPIIIEAPNRRTLIENLSVPRRTARPIKVRYKLEPAVGSVNIEGGNGATIKIDQEVRGRAPGRIEGVPPGAHHLVLERNGAPIYDNVIEIEVGGELTISEAAIAAETERLRPRPRIVAPARAPAPAPPSTRRGPSIAVNGVVDIGFRQFTYKNNQTLDTQQDEREAGQVLIGPILELWPTTLLGLDALHGLALYGRFQFSVNPQPVTMTDQSGAEQPTGLTTSWRSLELSVHHRWVIAGKGTIEVGAGYASDSYRFNGDASQIKNVPDASYDAVRIGGRASLLLGRLEPHVSIENRLVLSGGAMEDRYSLGTSVNGVRGALGAALHLGPLTVRLEGSLTLYSWTFKFDTDDPTRADGGSDFIQNVSLAIGYSH